jgi:hypothetical protein
VGSAEPRTGEHRHDRLGNHRHVNCDSIPFDQTELGQRIGRAADHVLELAIGNVAGIALRFTNPVESDPVTDTSRNMTIYTVHRGVELTTYEPLCKRRIPVQLRFPGPVPSEVTGLFRPESEPVFRGVVIDFRLGVGRIREFRRWWKTPSLVK